MPKVRSRVDALRATACHLAMAKGLSHVAADAEFDRLHQEAWRFRRSLDRLLSTLDHILTFEGWTPSRVADPSEATRFSPAPDADAATLRDLVCTALTEQMRSPADAAVFAEAFQDPQDLG